MFPSLESQWRSITAGELQLLEEFEKEIGLQKIETEALIYVAGYVAHRFRSSIMEEEFSKYHGPNTDSRIFDKLTNRVITRVDNNIFPHKIIHCLVRTRIYIRLRNINLKIKEQNTLRGRKYTKKMKNITNKII
ncbi:hypothetical protein ALC62_06353 [Cyphomyrmex costatus]|uniref:Uncharacterized protein n=1 Tax=Cyphomyrmex costatus TaxID=456900 RepID=A0A195CPY9_9HYME|nr:hypothetical protein ALC62_06353 [Cyphomyrmex costatus]